MLSRVMFSSHLASTTPRAPLSSRRLPVSLHSRRMCSTRAAAGDEKPTSALDDSTMWRLHSLPAILDAYAKSHLPQHVVQNLIQDHYEKEQQQQWYEKELQQKDFKLKMAVQDYLRAQGKFDARGLVEYAQRVLAISKEAAMAQDAHQKWMAVFKDKPLLLGCVEQKLGIKLVPSKVASMATNAYNLTSGAVYSGKFVQPDIDYIIIYEGCLTRDLMMLTECIAIEVNAPYKMVFLSEGTKNEV